jgi:hypothetical protein
MIKLSFDRSHVHEVPVAPATVSRIAIVGALSALSLLAGLPNVTIRPLGLESGSAAYAQGNNLPVGQYARSAFEIERLRQRKYAEAKQIMGGKVPDDVCRQSDIPQPVRDICNQLMSASSEIIKRNGLTVNQFNDITRRKDSDPGLQQQIQAELLRLQKATP